MFMEVQEDDKNFESGSQTLALDTEFCVEALSFFTVCNTIIGAEDNVDTYIDQGKTMRKGGNPKSGFNLDFEECS